MGSDFWDCDSAIPRLGRNDTRPTCRRPHRRPSREELPACLQLFNYVELINSSFEALLEALIASPGHTETTDEPRRTSFEPVP